MPNYNYGYPYGNIYQPFNNQPQQNYQQPQMNQFAFVNGIEGAKSFQMLPNQTIMLMDSENPIVYMKQSNGVGQSTLKYYKMTEISEQELKGQNSPNNAQNLQDYALKTDIENINKRIDELSELIKPKEVVNNG